jgi:acyl-CoA thioester hydrolase
MPYNRSYDVRWSDADANGHVRHTVYPELGAEVRLAWLAEGGFGWKRFEELGLGPVLLREEIDYLREVGLGGRVRVDLEAVGLSPDGARWKLRHTVYKEDGEIAARILVTGGWLDLARRRLAVPPPELARLLGSASRAPDYADLPPLRRKPE